MPNPEKEPLWTPRNLVLILLMVAMLIALVGGTLQYGLKPDQVPNPHIPTFRLP